VELQAEALVTHTDSSIDERDLIERARTDRRAFATLYRQYYPVVARYVHRRVGDRHVTEDLVAEVFMAALKAIPRFTIRGVSIRAWFYRLASNVVNRWVRRHRWRRMAGLEHEPAAEDRRDSSGTDARQALLCIAPKYQTVLALHYLEGMSIEDVATAVGCRTGTVKSRLSRGRQALREQLNRRST
jgi:RNA polymerase sigma-70 factor (ECF subfamily)